jgi:uncharacterized protein YhhL (DUF1145 family)
MELWKVLAFEFAALVHLVIWGVVLFASFCPDIRITEFTVYILIPFIYLVHTLPFHIIEETKKSLVPDEKQRTEQVNGIESRYILPDILKWLSSYFEKSFANPLSPQGMLILGMILGVYRLKKETSF